MKPWACGPFDVLVHGEMHYRAGEDLDRRIAMIGFDNAIELSITTYLTLKPLQRGDRTYEREAVKQALRSFHTRVEFFFAECRDRGVLAKCQEDEMIWFHDQRNGHYHGGAATVPQWKDLDGVRAAALEVFEILFDEPAVATLLDESIRAMAHAGPPRSEIHDRLIDSEHEMVEICGRPEYVSKLLYLLDPDRYRAVALELEQAQEDPGAEGLP